MPPAPVAARSPRVVAAPDVDAALRYLAARQQADGGVGLSGVPGFEAPVLRAYSARNRSGCVRIPWTESPKAKRVEARFPDPSANPYLAFAALLMAGLDGIKNKIDPGPASDKDLYDLPPEELSNVPTVCGSLREALGALDADRDYLKAGDVFTDDLIDGYIQLKWEEVYNFEHTPHPVEFRMYYSS